jgi:hypothetical protein
MHRRLYPLAIATALIVVVGIAFGNPAVASVATTASASSIDVRGTGTVELRGAIDADIAARYPVMLFKDIAGDATAKVAGSSGEGSFLGFTAYFSAQSAHVSGSDIEMIVVGAQIHVSATGNGWAYLKGTGTYATNGMANATWNADGTVVAMAVPPPDLADLFGAHGLFVAHGLGVVAVRGSVEYQAASGAGVLLVKDMAGGATVEVSGGEQGQFLGFKAYIGFHSAKIKGTDVAMIVAGVDLSVAARGTGWGYLQGVGAYSLNDGPSRPWDSAGLFADIAR